MGPAIPLYEPLESGMNDNIYISKSYDATSHFETTTGMINPVRRNLIDADMWQMTLEIFIGALKAKNSLLKALGKERIWLEKSNLLFLMGV